MNASRPEADTEYSSREGPGPASERGAGGARRRIPTGPGRRGSAALLAAVAVGCALLIVAEFEPLLHVRSGAYHGGVIETVQTGSHHSYALIPLALVALALAVGAWLGAGRAALVSIAVLGLVALGIALIHDLPATQSSGLIRDASGAFARAASSPGTGLWVETVGAVVLLLSAAAGLLLAPRHSV